MARLMFSAGILLAFASVMIVRSRGLMSGSPPPARAATVNSLLRRVKIFPRLASAAPFLCLIECHLEWPDMATLQKNQRIRAEMLPQTWCEPAASLTHQLPLACMPDHE